MNTAKRPNILFLVSDQHRADWLGTNENLPLRTPVLDQLAAEGMTFRQAYCDSPLCAPSRACLAVGKTYEASGVPSNKVNLSPGQSTFYQSLRESGYTVGGVGKFDLHKDLHKWNLDGSKWLREYGFTVGIDSEGKWDALGSYRREGNTPAGPYMQFLKEEGLIDLHIRELEGSREGNGAYTTRLPEEAYCDNWIAGNGLQLLESFPADKPWFLQVNFAGPHDPMDVTKRMSDRWQDVDFPPPHAHSETSLTESDHQELRRNYAAMIENIDRLAGKFLNLLKQRNELQNTIIVYCSDHGEMLGDFNHWGKQLWRQASVQIPLIVKGPGVLENAQSDALIPLHDLAATFLDLAHATPLQHTMSKSIAGLLNGSSEHHRSTVTSGLDNWKGVPSWRMITDGQFKLIAEKDRGLLLFNRKTDPTEEKECHSQHPEVVEKLLPELMSACTWLKR